MSTVEELIQLAAEGDEEAQEQLKAAYADLQQQNAAKDRDLKLKTDKSLRDKYPRALRAYDLNKLQFDGDLDDDGLAAALKAKEEELAELGVPLTPVVESEKPKAETEEKEEEEVPVQVKEDPAQALSGEAAVSSPAGQPRDHVYEYLELVTKGTTQHDQAKANQILIELQNVKGGDEKLRQITRALESPPINLKFI